MTYLIWLIYLFIRVKGKMMPIEVGGGKVAGLQRGKVGVADRFTCRSGIPNPLTSLWLIYHKWQKVQSFLNTIQAFKDNKIPLKQSHWHPHWHRKLKSYSYKTKSPLANVLDQKWGKQGLELYYLAKRVHQ